MNTQDDKRNSNINSYSSNKSSLRMSAISIDSRTVTPPLVHFTTTINDPPMPKLRDSSHFASSQFFQKNLNNSLETNNDNINNVKLEDLEGNWSLLDHMSLYVQVTDDRNTNTSYVNKDDQEEENIVAKQATPEGRESNPSSRSPYNSSWVPGSFSSSTILSRLSFFESNETNSQSSNVLQNDESQFASTANLANFGPLPRDDYTNTTNERGEELKSKNTLWTMPWRDEETKKFTKKFWLFISIIIGLILLLAATGIVLYILYIKKIIKMRGI